MSGSVHLDSVQDGFTALIAAAQEGHVRAVELLIAAKARVDIPQKVRFTICLCLLVITWMYTGWSHSIVHGQSGGSLWSC